MRDPVLAPVTNLNYRGFDLSYPDVERAKVFLRDLAEFEAAGKMPQLILHASRQRPHLGHRAGPRRAAFRLRR